MARMYQKLAPCGGEGGREWDDDVYEGVKKVYVGQDLTRITFVKFEYVKEDGQVVTREYGTITQNPKEFALEYPDEHITVVEGSYNKVAMYATEVITSLVFKTSKGKTSPTFGPNLFGVVNGTKFVFEDEGKKIVGFHGRSDKAIDALGVYFVQDSLTTSSPLYKLEARGGTEGRVWDDGACNGVKTLRIGQDDSRITYLEFEYEKGGKSETRPHGVKGEKLSEFVLDFPEEYIKSVEATYDKPSFFRNTVITSLKLETSKGRASIFGYEVGKKFVLKQNDHRIVGFHGKEGEAIDALGAYFAPVPTPDPVAPAPVPADPAPASPAPVPAAPAPAPAAPAPTPVIGDPWSDDIYDGVKKIQIGLYDEGVSFLKFEYIKGNGLVSGDGHGKITSLGVEEFVLEDGEYLMASLEGYYKLIPNTPFGKIVSLRFKTNKRESPLFGKESGEKFSLEQKDQKITGFHGRATDVIYDLMFSSRHISI